MKSILTTIALLLSGILFAQKFSLGPEIGVNLNNTQKTQLGTDYQFGMHLGVQVRYSLNKHFDLSSGIYFTQKKKKYTSIDTSTVPDPVASAISSASGGPGNSTASVYTTTNGLVSENLLEVPVLFHYNIYNFDFFAGPNTCILLSVHRKEISSSRSTAIDPSALLPPGSGGFGSLLAALTGPKQDVVATSSSKTGLTTFDVGAICGVGYHIDKFQLNLMYSYGFMDYRSDAKHKKREDLQLIRLSVAYLLPLKKKSNGNSSRIQ